MPDIEIIKDFEGASIGKYDIRGNRIFVALREEPLAKSDGITHDYNWHFAFGLRNNNKTAQELELFINCDTNGGLNYRGSIFGQYNHDLDFYPLSDIESYTDTYRKYYLKIKLKEEGALFISNTFFRSPASLARAFDNIYKTGFSKKQVYGESGEGRELVSFVYSGDGTLDNPKPTFLITSGFHPMEPDTLATEAIMEFLKSSQGQDLLKYFNFVIIPMVNPDGFYHGYNGCNSRGINLYWDFRAEDKTNSPEAYYLWDYILKIKPALYIDFHSYTFQAHRKKASAYIKPLSFYGGREVRKLVKSINGELINLHNGSCYQGVLTFAPSTLSYKLTKAFNTVCYAKYHLHIMGGLEEFKNKAVKAVQVIAGCLKKNGFLDKQKILLYPNGMVKRSIFEVMISAVKVLWAFKIKRFIKNIFLSSDR